MLGFGLVLLLAPNLLTNPAASIGVLVVAVIAAILLARFTNPATA